MPTFLVGHSMGGMISLFLAAENPGKYAGTALLTPYIDQSKDTRDTLAKLMPAAKFLNWCWPTKQLAIP
jgi:alpha-beta hydrolase superfamily lysophospholipase